MDTHPDPDQFVKKLITDDSAVTGYLVAEVLNPQPPAVRDVLLSTSILEYVNAQAARELTGNEQAGTILPTLARANAFVRPAGSGGTATTRCSSRCCSWNSSASIRTG